MAQGESHPPPGDRAGHDAGAEGPDIDELRRRIEALQDDVARADKHVRAAVHDRPFVAVGVAVLAGFVLGRLIGRA